MKYQVIYSKRFLKSLDRVKQWPGYRDERLRFVIRALSHGEVLDVRFHDHELKGDMVGYRECHIAPDILVVYHIDNGILTLTLINIGNHAQLFK
jgi:mRNA interferase YafQ